MECFGKDSLTANDKTYVFLLLTHPVCLLHMHRYSIMAFSSRARRGSLWFSWPSVAHRLHRLPLKFMKPSSSLPPLRRVILHVRDFYYWNDTFMTASPRHTRAASWIISAKGGREMRYGRLSEVRHLRSVSHHNIPIHMNEKNNLTCIKLKFTKNHDLGGVMVESFPVVSSGGDEAGGGWVLSPRTPFVSRSAVSLFSRR